MQPAENALKVVECSGSPRELGRQYGEGAREMVRHNVEYFTGRRWDTEASPAAARTARGVLGECLPDVLEELEGLAEGAGADLDRVILMNQVDTFGPDWQECTPIGLASSDVGPIVAKNNDGADEDRASGKHEGRFRYYLVRRILPEHGVPQLQVTYAGWLSGLDAINAEGVAATHASVGSQFDKSGPRVDIRLVAHSLMMRCRTAKDFLAGLANAPLTGKGFNVLVGDKSGDLAVVEAAVPLVSWRGRGGQFLYSTNHYNSPPLREADARLPDKKVISQRRFGYLEWVAQTRPPRTLEDMKALFSSHDPWAPCRHGGATKSFTEWSMICLPQRGEALVAPGAPCKTEYAGYSAEG